MLALKCVVLSLSLVFKFFW